jgi:hypothetical protein
MEWSLAIVALALLGVAAVFPAAIGQSSHVGDGVRGHRLAQLFGRTEL